MSKVTLLAGDVIEVLKTLPDKSVHACICSPPFYGLRDYGTGTWEGGDAACDHIKQRGGHLAESAASTRGGAHKQADAQAMTYRDTCGKCGATRIDQQIGLEESPELYVARLVEVFREVRRVLRDDGTVWLNLGDSFWAGKGKNGSSKARATAKERGYHQSAGTVQVETKVTDGRHAVFKPKDLMLIPSRVAIALVEDGWYLRQDIIWAKSNPMPESVSDRPTTSHEHIFLLAKQRHYYYDGEAIKEPSVYPDDNRKARAKTDHKRMPSDQIAGIRPGSQTYPIRQKRSVWSIPTKPYKGAHFAAWPEALVEPMLLASTSAKGCCPTCGAPWRRIHDQDADLWGTSCKCGGDLEPVPCTAIDIFSGAGTTGVVCVKHGRDFIGIDLNPSYLTLAKQRIGKVQPLLLLEAE